VYVHPHTHLPPPPLLNDVLNTRPGLKPNKIPRHPSTTDRTKRVREARDEAKKEIEAYRAAKEAEYLAFEAEVRFQVSIEEKITQHPNHHLLFFFPITGVLDKKLTIPSIYSLMEIAHQGKQASRGGGRA
jgi:hypothetical protein